jgi:hypothetical protein
LKWRKLNEGLYGVQIEVSRYGVPNLRGILDRLQSVPILNRRMCESQIENYEKVAERVAKIIKREWSCKNN